MIFNIFQTITPSGISGIKIVESINNLENDDLVFEKINY